MANKVLKNKSAKSVEPKSVSKAVVTAKNNKNAVKTVSPNTSKGTSEKSVKVGKTIMTKKKAWNKNSEHSETLILIVKDKNGNDVAQTFKSI